MIEKNLSWKLDPERDFYKSADPNVSKKMIVESLRYNGQSLKRYTGTAFALLARYNVSEKVCQFIPCDLAFDSPDEVEDQRIVSKSRNLQLEFKLNPPIFNA